MATIELNSIFTNTAKTDDGDVWWEGMTGQPPDHVIDWHGNEWTPDSDETAAHPNSRFTTPASQCPSIADEWEDPAGVPIDAFLFGGRRSTVVPLVFETRDWEHGVFTGAVMSSETTAAAAGEVGKLRFDPMAMLPFCGYNMADYFGHWLKLGRREGAKMPRVFHVNWFRKGDDGKFLWPGFGENSRVLEWVFRRCDDESETVESAIGLLPAPGELNTDGLDISDEAVQQLLTVDDDALRAQMPQVEEHLARFGDDLTDELKAQLEALKQRLG
jgi:phosphoenolpyruvate carboxykinase (GTP)